MNREQVRNVDRRAIDEYGMSGLVLMENAGRGAAEVIHRFHPESTVAILCGTGNNGGDGFVIARHLELLGQKSIVFLVADNPQRELSADAQANWIIIEKAGFRIEKIESGDETVLRDTLNSCSVIVDALLGTGARGAPRSPYDRVIRLANQSSARRVAIDIPSGLDCDTGKAAEPCFQADLTVTFVDTKPGFLLRNGPAHTGLVQVVEIGVPRQLLGTSNPTPHGPWSIIKSNLVYRDPWIRLVQDDVIRPDGKPGTYAVTHVKPGVCVLAIDDEGNAYLTEEFHYGVGRVTLELVSGGIDGEEDCLTAAKRELNEELGIAAIDWQDLGSCDPFTANVVSPVRLFVARRLRFGKNNPDECEQIRLVKLPLRTAIAAATDGRITHAPSCLLLLSVAYRARHL